jgi:hypothetical protein
MGHERLPFLMLKVIAQERVCSMRPDANGPETGMGSSTIGSLSCLEDVWRILVGSTANNCYIARCLSKAVHLETHAILIRVCEKGPGMFILQVHAWPSALCLCICVMVTFERGTWR